MFFLSGTYRSILPAESMIWICSWGDIRKSDVPSVPGVPD